MVKKKVFKKNKSLSVKEKEDLKKSRKIESESKKKDEELEFLEDLYIRELLNKISNKVVSVSSKNTLRADNLEEEVLEEAESSGIKSNSNSNFSYESRGEDFKNYSTSNSRDLGGSSRDDAYLVSGSVSDEYISGSASSVDPSKIQSRDSNSFGEGLVFGGEKRIGLEESFRGTENIGAQVSHTGEFLSTRFDPAMDAGRTFAPEGGNQDGYATMSPMGEEDKKKYESRQHG